jgi:hypothetical protein
LTTSISAADSGRQKEAKNLLGRPADELTEPLVTDRPDFTESTDAIPPGWMQLEMGYTFTYDREKDVRLRDHGAPELLLRAGVFEDFELRIGWDGYTWAETQFRTETEDDRLITEEDWDQGAYDATLGVKYKFFDQQGWRPNFGVIAEVSVPSGTRGVSSGDVDPGLVLLWAYDLTDRMSLAGNVGVASLTTDSSRFTQAKASLSLATAITDRLGGYVEYFGIYPNARHTDCAHSVNGGLTYLITDDLQLDWRIGAGLNEEADDFFAGFGVAWRF